MAEQSILIIDDRSTIAPRVMPGNEWYLITDGVMGGISKGHLSTDLISGRECLRMQGEIKLENNGGFVQIALDFPKEALQNITTYTGLMLEVHGNNEQYNVHLRTDDIWLPWQSYRAMFFAPSEWKIFYIPFAEFKPYRIRKKINIDKLKRIGLVAIGREFSADLCVRKIGLYT